MVGQQNLPRRRQHVNRSEPCKILIYERAGQKPSSESHPPVGMSQVGQLLAPYTLVWVIRTSGKTETDKSSSNTTIGLKRVFCHTTQVQLWGWILIRDLFSLPLEMCHPSHSFSSPARFVASSAQRKKKELHPTCTLGDGEPHPPKNTLTSHRRRDQVLFKSTRCSWTILSGPSVAGKSKAVR